MADIKEEALKMHLEHHGKVEVVSKVPLKTAWDLTLAYTPGVADVCRAIAEDRHKVFDYTSKGNLVAVVSDGTAVLGLGDIGPEAAMPVMEGKAILFKTFAGVDAFPICVATKEVDEIVQLVKLLEPTFGGINLEDIAAPRCFEIEAKLKAATDIPIFHDDQHGTAIVVLAGIINGLRLVGKRKEVCRVVVNGAGSAGVAVTKLLLRYGFVHVTLCDRAGILSKQSADLNWAQQEMMEVTNLAGQTGTLADALQGADIFVGVSGPNVVTPEMVAAMNHDAILFAMANPVPEIMPDLAKAAGARVIGTGRSDFPNQINNVVAFPGIFRGALDMQATDINEEMKLAAAYAIADFVGDDLSADFVIPSTLDPRIGPAVAKAVAQAAIDTGVARAKDMTPDQVAQRCHQMMTLNR